MPIFHLHQSVCKFSKCYDTTNAKHMISPIREWCATVNASVAKPPTLWLSTDQPTSNSKKCPWTITVNYGLSKAQLCNCHPKLIKHSSLESQGCRPTERRMDGQEVSFSALYSAIAN